MSKHAPGPWTAEHDGHGGMCVESADGRQVGFVSNQPEQPANARLIASAPDLLEALVAITDQLEQVGDTRPHKDGHFIEDARAAIAKAQG